MNSVRSYVENLDAPETKPMSTTRAMVLSAILALGIGNAVPSQTHADKSENKAAKMAQDGGGY